MTQITLDLTEASWGTLGLVLRAVQELARDAKDEGSGRNAAAAAAVIQHEIILRAESVLDANRKMRGGVS